MTSNSSPRPWSPTDELNLLDAIQNHGIGNWGEVSKFVSTFTPEDCERHFFEKFLKDHELTRPGRGLCRSSCKVRVDEVSYPLSLSNVLLREEIIKGCSWDGLKCDESEDVGKKSRHLFCTLGVPGYRPERSDFEVELDDGAEKILALLSQTPDDEDEGDDEIYSELKAALVKAYNFRLSERVRRKKIIRTHALLDRRKTYNILQRNEGFGKQTLYTLLKLSQFFPCGPLMDLLLERIKLQKELQLKINAFLNYRRQGLKLMSSIDIYEKLFRKRLKYKKELETISIPLSMEMVATRSSKRVSTPLVVHNLPGYTLLNDEEKDLCANARIVPETYNGFKNLLIQECTKNGGLKLAQARQLIKIDVNKTRKMYDYLMSKNLIWLPSS